MSLKNNNNNHLNDYNLTFKHIYTQGFFLERKEERERKKGRNKGKRENKAALTLPNLFESAR